MKTDSAVEWLRKELESYGDTQFCKIEWKQLDSLIEQAKEMEQMSGTECKWVIKYSKTEKMGNMLLKTI